VSCDGRICGPVSVGVRSTRTTIKRDAYDVAVELAQRIAGGISADDTWRDDFCQAFEEDVEQRRSRRAQEPWKTTKKHIAELQPFAKLSEVTRSWVSMFQAKLRKTQLAESTIRSYLARLRIANVS